MTDASEKTKQRPALEELLFGLFLAALAGGVFYATRRLSVNCSGREPVR